LLNTGEFIATDTLTTFSDYYTKSEIIFELPEGGRHRPASLKLDSRDYPVVCHSHWGDLVVSRKIPSTVDLQLSMPDVYFEPGSNFYLDLSVINSGDAMENVPLWCILDIADQFYYWPDWTSEPEFGHIDIPAGETILHLIEPFNWPVTGDEIIGRNRFYAAILNQDSSEILEISSGVEKWTFNYGPTL